MFPFLYLLDLILYGLHGPGVGLTVDIFDLLIHQVGVDLGGRNVRVAQHLLDGTQVRTVLQQVGGEGVAQGVGRDVLLDARLLLIVLDELPKALAAHPLPVHVHIIYLRNMQKDRLSQKAAGLKAGRTLSHI